MDSFGADLDEKKRLAREQGLGAIVDAHMRSTHHRAELMASEIAGCFYCCTSFSPACIEEWVDEWECAICPKCGIDSVIGSASGYPIQDSSFLKAMNEFWFA